MKQLWRTGTVALTTLAVTGLVFLGSTSGGGKKKLAASVDELAAALKKGDAGADKLAAQIAKAAGEAHDLMHLTRIRSKGGFGVGPADKPLQPDEMEKMIRELSKNALPANKLKDDANALIGMAYRSAAVAKTTLPLAPKKGKANWTKYADQMYESSIQLAKEISAGDANKVLATAGKINTACNNCHSEFR